MDAFDADVLVYAAATGNPLGRRVRALFLTGSEDPDTVVGIGSVVLLPELLSKPVRDGLDDEVASLTQLLARLDLRPTDEATAHLATSLGARYRLRAADAIHLATAVGAGCERFITNNRRDFGPEISEIDVVHPEDLPAP